MLKSNRFLEKCSFIHLSQDTWLFFEKEMATDSSVLAWKNLMEPGRLQSMGSQRVGHD